MQEKIPQQSAGVVGQGAGPKALLYDQTTGKIHVLNRTAFDVWKLCNGRNSVSDIERQIRAKYRIEDDKDVASDIATILRTFFALRVIESTPGKWIRRI